MKIKDKPGTRWDWGFLGSKIKGPDKNRDRKIFDIIFFCLNKTSTLGQSQKCHKDVATLVSFQLFTLLSPDLFFAHATYVLIMGRYVPKLEDCM